MRAPIKEVGPGFAAFLSREMFCKASGCRWQWFAERVRDKPDGARVYSGTYVSCQGCGSSYPWRDTYYLRRIYELETE